MLFNSLNIVRSSPVSKRCHEEDRGHQKLHLGRRREMLLEMASGLQNFSPNDFQLQSRRRPLLQRKLPGCAHVLRHYRRHEQFLSSFSGKELNRIRLLVYLLALCAKRNEIEFRLFSFSFGAEGIRVARFKRGVVASLSTKKRVVFK